MYMHIYTVNAPIIRIVACRMYSKSVITTSAETTVIDLVEKGKLATMQCIGEPTERHDEFLPQLGTHN